VASAIAGGKKKQNGKGEREGEPGNSRETRQWRNGYHDRKLKDLLLELLLDLSL
jgi:hypothetical protein